MANLTDMSDKLYLEDDLVGKVQFTIRKWPPLSFDGRFLPALISKYFGDSSWPSHQAEIGCPSTELVLSSGQPVQARNRFQCCTVTQEMFCLESFSGHFKKTFFLARTENFSNKNISKNKTGLDLFFFFKFFNLF